MLHCWLHPHIFTCKFAVHLLQLYSLSCFPHVQARKRSRAWPWQHVYHVKARTPFVWSFLAYCMCVYCTKDLHSWRHKASFNNVTFALSQPKISTTAVSCLDSLVFMQGSWLPADCWSEGRRASLDLSSHNVDYVPIRKTVATLLSSFWHFFLNNHPSKWLYPSCVRSALDLCDCVVFQSLKELNNHF